MIQRKQSIYLFLASLLTFLSMFMQTDSLTWPLLAMLCGSSLLSLVTIFLYKNRVLQARLCVVGIFLLLAWGIVLAALPSMSDGSALPEWPAAFVIVSIIFLFLAHKGIVADEKLVRSLDRIR